jgi:hypothetical protein
MADRCGRIRNRSCVNVNRCDLVASSAVPNIPGTGASPGGLDVNRRSRVRSIRRNVTRFFQEFEGPRGFFANPYGERRRAAMVRLRSIGTGAAQPGMEEARREQLNASTTPAERYVSSATPRSHLVSPIPYPTRALYAMHEGLPKTGASLHPIELPPDIDSLICSTTWDAQHVPIPPGFGLSCLGR